MIFEIYIELKVVMAFWINKRNISSPKLTLNGLLVELIGHLVGVAFDAPNEKGISLIECVHETVQALLKLCRNCHRLLSGLAWPRAVALRSASQSLHRLQILETLFASLPWSERLVLPVGHNCAETLGLISQSKSSYEKTLFRVLPFHSQILFQDKRNASQT